VEEEHPPTRLTLSQAARVTRIPRSTLKGHIDAGRLRQNPDGTIDTAALRQALPIIHPNTRLRQRQEAQVRKGRPPRSTQIEQAQLQEDYRHAYYDIMKRTGRRPSQLDVAEELFISERTLRRYLKRGGLPWPPP
jgi:AraC-like DNA-binding protein